MRITHLSLAIPSGGGGGGGAPGKKNLRGGRGGGGGGGGDPMQINFEWGLERGYESSFYPGDSRKRGSFVLLDPCTTRKTRGFA